MKTYQLLYFIFIIIFFGSCGKSDKNVQPTPIDVSAQWVVDPSGLPISGPLDGQWQAKVFTAQEQDLFTSLDTANLTGTMKPDSVFDKPNTYNYTYPNPFYQGYGPHLGFRFTNGFAGQMIYKCVIVDSLMNARFKAAARIQATFNPLDPSHVSTTNLALLPNLPVGRFRIYFTLSSQSNEHFYKSWGNVQVLQ